MRACEHCLAGEIRGFFISVPLLRREWMRVLPVVYQTDHLLVGGGRGSLGGVEARVLTNKRSERQGKYEEDAVKKEALSGRRRRKERVGE